MKVTAAAPQLVGIPSDAVWNRQQWLRKFTSISAADDQYRFISKLIMLVMSFMLVENDIAQHRLVTCTTYHRQETWPSSHDGVKGIPSSCKSTAHDVPTRPLYGLAASEIYHNVIQIKCFFHALAFYWKHSKTWQMTAWIETTKRPVPLPVEEPAKLHSCTLPTTLSKHYSVVQLDYPHALMQCCKWISIIFHEGGDWLTLRRSFRWCVLSRNVWN